jgi:NAD(P)H-dependent flavin oxidoreductase YrpB (nitropropane dioxygenase family)
MGEAGMANELQRILGVEIPIILAPMGGVVGPELAAAVSNAGGLAIMPKWRGEPAEVREAIRDLRKRTPRPFGINLNLQYPQEERLAACIDEGVRIVSLFWGLSAPLVKRAHAAGMTVLQTIGSAEEARRAADMGVDIVVAQGWEAGGHVWGTVATLALVPAVVDAVGPVPVVAAGGIADGRGVAAVMALGSAGAWIGTRFIMANEAEGRQVNRDALIAASEAGTVMGKDANETWRDSAIRWVGSPSGRWDYDYWPEGTQLAGQSVGLVRRVQPAAEIVAEIWAEAKAVMKDLGQREV